MAKYADIDINIASPPVDEECTTSYYVEYRIIGELGWTLLNGVGYTTNNPIRIEPLAPSTDYEYRITRNCCNSQSATTEGSFTTPA